MKTTVNTFLSVFFILFFALLVACSPQKASAEMKKERPITLNQFGFHIFPEPIDIPPFTVTSLTGQTLKSTELAGTITLLNFWATWCPPCKQEMPSLQKLNDAMKSYPFRIVAISTGESRKTVETFISKNNYTFPIFLDENSAVGTAFASQGIPTTYILDKKGRLIAGIVGSREYADPDLILLLKELSSK